MKLKKIILFSFGALLSSALGFFMGTITLASQLDTSNISGKYLVAVYATKNKDYETAANYLEKIIKAEPNNSILKKKAILPMIRAGRVQKSIDIISSLEEFELFNEAKILLALGEIEKENYEEAQNILKKADDVGLYSILLKYINVWLEAGQGDFDAAFFIFETLPENTKNLSITYYQKGLVYEFKGDDKKAIEQYEKAIEQGGDRYRMFEALSCAYGRQGQKEKIPEVYKQYQDRIGYSIITPSCNVPKITSAKQGVAESLMYAVLFYSYHKMVDYAYIYVNLSLYLNPEFSYGNWEQASFLNYYKNYQKSTESYGKIGTTSPLYTQAQLRIIGNHQESGNAELAIKMLSELAEKNNISELWLSLGHALSIEKKYKKASVVYTKAIKLLPKAEKKDWELFYSRGISYERNDEWNKAEADFLKALELYENQPDVLNYLAYTWVDKGENLEKSKKMLEKALEQKPYSPHILDSYAWALFYVGEYEKALENMEKAVEKMPYNSTLNDHLGDIYWRLGRTREAKFLWNRAVYYDPENEEIKNSVKQKLENGLPAIQMKVKEVNNNLLR